MSGAEIGQKLVNGPAVVTSRLGIQRNAEGVARGSRGNHRQRADVLGHGAGILQVDVLWRNLRVEQCGLDVGVPHLLHECGQTDAGAYPVRVKGMTAMPNSA